VEEALKLPKTKGWKGWMESELHARAKEYCRTARYIPYEP